jgi:hypothetical protein
MKGKSSKSTLVRSKKTGSGPEKRTPNKKSAAARKKSPPQGTPKKKKKVVSKKKKAVSKTADPSSSVTTDTTTTPPPPPVVDAAVTAETPVDKPPADKPPADKPQHTWRNRLFVFALIFLIGFLVAPKGSSDTKVDDASKGPTSLIPVFVDVVAVSGGRETWKYGMDAGVFVLALFYAMWYWASGGETWDSEFSRYTLGRESKEDREKREKREEEDNQVRKEVAERVREGKARHGPAD